MNTDEVRARFEELNPMPEGSSFDCEYMWEITGDKDLNSKRRKACDAQSYLWKGYQQATKESEAEIERLTGHIIYLRDEVADREAENKALKVDNLKQALLIDFHGMVPEVAPYNELEAMRAEIIRLKGALTEISNCLFPSIEYGSLTTAGEKQYLVDLAFKALKEDDNG